MSEFPAIEANIPPPHNAGSKTGKPGRPHLYPWGSMNPGDSIFIPGIPRAFGGSLHAWQKKHPKQKFATRIETKDGHKGVRVWRMK